MLVPIIVSGLTIGAIYALIAIGFTVVFSTNRLINFAHGEFVMAGGMLYAWLTGVHQMPIALAFIAATLLSGMIAWMVYEVGLSGVDRDNHIAQVMITLGAGITLKGAAQVFLGKETLFPPAFSGSEPVKVGMVSVSSQAIWIAGGLFAFLLLLHVLLKHTRVGASMRAVSINHYAATLMGISPARAGALSFALAGVIGGAAGGLLAPLASTHYDNGIFLAIKGFAAAIVGGIGSPIGAVVGGLVLGLTESLAAGYFSSVYKDVVSLGLLIAVLLLRPQGLLGKPLPQKL
jgi:branched-chain amino acid transport system permease protein